MEGEKEKEKEREKDRGKLGGEVDSRNNKQKKLGSGSDLEISYSWSKGFILRNFRKTFVWLGEGCRVRVV